MIHVLTTLYNAEPYIERCLRTIQAQTVQQWRCIVLDDLSTDKSWWIAERLALHDERFDLRGNSEKLYQPGNYAHALADEQIADEDIIITVDGDDFLSDPQVFERVLQAYADEHTWITWGSFMRLRQHKLQPGLSGPVQDVTQVRKHTWKTSHLRTFKAFLWRAIRDEDLHSPTGNYWEVTGDMAFMFPMLEMATNAHAKFLSACNYIYNHDNPLCDSTLQRGKQQEYERLLRAMPPYAPLVRL